MGTEILSFGSLEHELEEARSSLKGVDESIKRLIGRDPSELLPRNVQKRSNEDKGRSFKASGRIRNFVHENEEPPVKRRSHISVFKRLSDKVPDNDDSIPHKGLISKVIVTPKKIPSREQALEAQNKDEKFKARNKRMFGALLGTLQKFQQEESKLKQREQKRAELEKKIEEHEIKEKEEVKKEKQELFLNRKKKQAEIKMIELKMLRMKDYASWEQSQKPKLNYILTKTKPHIYYIPRKMTDQSKKLLEESSANLQESLDIKKKQVAEELQNIEEKMKKNFDYKFGHKEEKEETQVEGDSRRRHDDNDDKDNDDQFDDIHDSQSLANDEDNVKEKNSESEQEAKELDQQEPEKALNGDSHEVKTNDSLNTVINEPVTSVMEDTSGVTNASNSVKDYSTESNDNPSFNNSETLVNDTVTDYQYAEYQSEFNTSEYNSQEFQNSYNNISVQLGNFGPQTSD